MPLTLKEKLTAVEQSGFPIAFDGCHKIYFLIDDERKADAAQTGYEPFFLSTEIRQLIRKSCGLVFVSKWGLDNGDFAHPWNIEQFDRELNLLRA